MIQQFGRVNFACAALEVRGYTVEEVKLRVSKYRSNKEMYTIEFSPAANVPWSRYTTNRIFGPNIETIIEKIQQLPRRGQ